MAATHIRDAFWDTDLIWHYFQATNTPANPGRFGKYYSNQDPLGELSDRHRVYDMLVDEKDHTEPELMATEADTMDNYKKSKIPWNQNNGGFLKAVNDEYWCGSIIKMVFIRYMKWKDAEPALPNQKYPGRRGSNAVQWTIDNLKNNVPVRASLGGKHYVGIVGHRAKTVVGPVAIGASPQPYTEFLCIDPWAYGTDGTNTDTKYAGRTTAFLGISTQIGASWTYGKAGKIVQWVETPP